MGKSQVKANTSKKYLKMIFNVILISALCYGVIYGSVYGMYGLTLLNEGFKEWVSNNSLITLIVNATLFLVIFYLIMTKINKQKRDKMYDFSKISLKSTGIICVIGIVVGLFTTSVFKIPFIQNNYPQFQVTMDALADVNNLVMFILFLVLNSIYKEVLFRGALFNELRNTINLTVAVILQGLLYGVLFFQTDIPQIIYGFLGALLFVYLYIWFDSLLAPLVAQISSTGSFFIYRKFFYDSITVESVKFIIPITVVIAGVLIYYLRKNKDNLKLVTQDKKDNDYSIKEVG